MHARATSWDSAFELDKNPFADSPGPSQLARNTPTFSRLGQHPRSPTEDDHHPLRSAGLRNGYHTGDITRPSLFRVLNSDSGPESRESSSSASSSPGQKTVLVHEVSNSDSLPGVALKYGMTLADLRRANHMWTNDTIHLRKILFIPLDKSPKARQIYEEQEEASEEEEDHQSQPSTSSISDSASRTHPATIRRVPVSQLSYFPPPSRKVSPRSLRPPSVHVRAPSSPSASPNLSSLFSSAIPIADTIISRLSLDGIPSERRRTSFEQEGANGHELLDVLPVRPSLDGGLERVQRGDKNLGHPRRAATTWDAWHTTASRTRPSSLQASTSSPTDPTRSIRTNQLEPQPEMLIPSRKSASMRSNASGRSHNTYSAGDKHQSQTHLPSPKKSRPGLQGLFEAPDGIEL